MIAIAVVAIGRNEGERLRACLNSVLPHVSAVVYVDSGSTDGSVEFATSVGAAVVNLDIRRPFTAARARNEGFRRVLDIDPTTEFVHFVDGDCEVMPGWLDEAHAFLKEHADVAAVCGRRRERHPDASIYNLLCEASWDVPSGEAIHCGGDVLMRVSAFQRVGGFRDELVAGEEPELCIRLRAQRWRIWRLGSEMTLHDAAMTRFSQWWKRTVRTGYAFAEGAYLHGAPPERHWVRESLSSWLWGFVLPLGLLLSVLMFGPEAAWGFLLYPLQVVRLYAFGDGPPKRRAVQSVFLLLGKFAEMIGQFKFLANLLAGRRAALIEYK